MLSANLTKKFLKKNFKKKILKKIKMKWTDEDAAISSVAAHKLLMSRKFKSKWLKTIAKNNFVHRLDKEVANSELKSFSLQKSTMLFKNLKFILKAEIL